MGQDITTPKIDRETLPIANRIPRLRAQQQMTLHLGFRHKGRDLSGTDLLTGVIHGSTCVTGEGG
jgi:hypothetical protein